MPDSARDLSTLDEVLATVLLQRVIDDNDPLSEDDLKAMEFICLACNARMTTIAIRPGMVVVPHFRVEDEHEAGCDVEGYEKLVKNRSKQSVSTSEGFPTRYPVKLRLPSDREVVDRSESGQSEIATCGSTTSGISSKKEGSRKPNWTVTSLRPLVKHFIGFPNFKDRCISLLVPGVEVETYGQVFQRLKFKDNCCYENTRIYFGRLQYSVSVSFTNNYVVLPFAEGEWEDVAGRKSLVKQYFLKVNMTSWSKSKKQVLQREFEACIKQFKEKSRLDRAVRPWLFFLGKQSLGSNEFQLLVDDHRLICCVTEANLQEERFSSIATRISIQDVKETSNYLNQKNSFSQDPKSFDTFNSSVSKSQALPIPKQQKLTGQDYRRKNVENPLRSAYQISSDEITENQGRPTQILRDSSSSDSINFNVSSINLRETGVSSQSQNRKRRLSLLKKAAIRLKASIIKCFRFLQRFLSLF